MPQKAAPTYKPLDEASIREVFSSLDTDADGKLDIDELKVVLRKLGMPCTSGDARELMQADKTEQHPTMDFDAFQRFVAEQEGKLHAIFREIDSDNSGTIDLNEFSRAVAKINTNATDRDCQQLLRRLDRDKDNAITFHEFREALLLLPSVQVAAVFDYWTRSSIDIGESFTVPEEKTSTSKQQRTFIAGAVAGAVSRTATAPLDRLKVILQASTGKASGLVDGLKGIYREGGLRAFWRGNGANVVKIAPESGMRFWAFDTLKPWIAKDPRNTTMWEKLCCGALAGSAAQSVVYPLETIKTRLAIAASGTYKGIVDCAAKTYTREGMRGLYRGYIPSVVGIAPYCGVDLMIYNGLKEEYTKRYNDVSPGPLTLLACGTISSSCGQLIAYPFALVRTRLQAQGTPGSVQYRGMLHCFTATVQQNGVGGLYRGLQANFLKALPAVAISYLTYEQVMAHL